MADFWHLPDRAPRQPWRVAAVESEQAPAFAERFEGRAWEYVYPALRLGIVGPQDAPGKN